MSDNLTHKDMCEQRNEARLNDKLERAWDEITRLRNVISDQADEIASLRLQLKDLDPSQGW